jgi:hypothetical protein
MLYEHTTYDTLTVKYYAIISKKNAHQAKKIK